MNTARERVRARGGGGRGAGGKTNEEDEEEQQQQQQQEEELLVIPLFSQVYAKGARQDPGGGIVVGRREQISETSCSIRGRSFGNQVGEYLNKERELPFKAHAFRIITEKQRERERERQTDR